ncbi:hypothetical protein V2J09_017041 [Rumex salicifolius]
MEANGTSFRRRRQSSADRFLDVFSQSPPSTAGDELSEDDVFWSGDSAESSGPLSSSSYITSAAPPGGRDHRSSPKAFGRVESFGILAALPEMEQERSNRRSIFNHKNSSTTPASASALASSSTSRMIPVIPRPPPERTFSASLKYQSAPMNVPMMLRRNDFDRHQKGRLLEENEELEEDDEEGEMLPPHEIVARQSVKSPVLSSSVLEGAGRTLKGRDLRQVRNAMVGSGPLKSFEQRIQFPNGSGTHLTAHETQEYGFETGISILVKCDQMKKPAMATTNKGGSFEANLPLSSSTSSNCRARLFAGPKQLYALNKNIEAKVIRVSDQANTYTTASTMTFATSCSSLATLGRCPSPLGSSKTVDLPIPPEYGLPPTSYYLAPLAPFIPIIGASFSPINHSLVAANFRNPPSDSS